MAPSLSSHPLPTIPARRRRARAAALVALAALVLGACGTDDSAGPADSTTPTRPTTRYSPDGLPDRPVPALPSSPRNVLWICLDTVRADAFGPWTRAGATTSMPRTSDWLARNAVAFREAASTSPWTGPSIASLLTGLLPSRHGARELSDSLTLIPALATAAEIFAAQGFRTGAYTGGGWLTKGSGILQGFEDVELPFSFAGVATHLVERIRGQRKTDRLFLFVHTYEAHDPYLAPPATPGPPPPVTPLAAEALALIDRETQQDGGRALARRFLLDPATRTPVFLTVAGKARIAAVTRWFEQGFPIDPQRDAFAAEARTVYDRGLARLDDGLAGYLEALRAGGLLDETVLVLSSDHGEGFGEHASLHHGRRLYDELIHAPLYVRAPGWPTGTVIRGSCSLADVLPTLLELFGLPAADGIDGQSLVPLLAGGAGRPVRSEERKTPAETGLLTDETLVSVRDASRKWIATIDKKSGAIREEAYDLAKDPREEHALPAGSTDAWPEPFRDAMRDARRVR